MNNAGYFKTPATAEKKTSQDQLVAKDSNTLWTSCGEDNMRRSFGYLRNSVLLTKFSGAVLKTIHLALKGSGMLPLTRTNSGESLENPKRQHCKSKSNSVSVSVFKRCNSSKKVQ